MRALVMLLGLAAAAVAVEPQAEMAQYDRALAAYDAANASKDPKHPGYTEAYEGFASLAENGHGGATYHLAMLHMFGLGGAIFDQVEAVTLINDAAESGYPLAQSYVGRLYEQGVGFTFDETHVEEVEPDESRALAWYRKAAAQEQCVALRRLAGAYRDGELGLTADAEQAEALEARLPSCRRR